MADQDIELNPDTGEIIEKSQQAPEENNNHPEDDENLSYDTEGSTSDDSSSDDDDSNDNNPTLSDEEREAIRERRRKERHHKKQAQRDREDTLRRELAARDAVISELRGKVDLIERRNTGSEMAQLENSKKQAQQAYNFFKDQIRIGTESGNGAAVADATEKMFQAQRRLDDLTKFESAFKQKQQAPQPLDPRLVNHAQGWMERNKWYDPTAKDQDSRVAMTLDQQMAQEGWNPTTPEYWQELDNRIKKYLPHRSSSGKITNNKPRSVVPGSGRESSSSAGGAPTSYKLSGDRVQALKDAGIWDDHKQRAEAIKRFREYDKTNQG